MDTVSKIELEIEKLLDKGIESVQDARQLKLLIESREIYKKTPTMTLLALDSEEYAALEAEHFLDEFSADDGQYFLDEFSRIPERDPGSQRESKVPERNPVEADEAKGFAAKQPAKEPV